jgi:isoleucyl-tRNA synthetase
VRQVQAARREAGLAVTDCITLQIAALADVACALKAHRAYVAEQTLAVSLKVTEADSLSIKVAKTPC